MRSWGPASLRDALIYPRFSFVFLEKTRAKTTIDWRSPNRRTVTLTGQGTQSLQSPVIQFSARPKPILLLKIAYGSYGFWTRLAVDFPTIKSLPRQLVLHCLHHTLLDLTGCSGIQSSSVHHSIIGSFVRGVILAIRRVIPRVNVFFVTI